MEIIANIPGQGLASVIVEGERIRSVGTIGAADPNRPMMSLGFVDIQINGYAGVDFSAEDFSAKKAISILPAIWKTGTTTICATLITNTLDRLQRNFQILEKARNLDGHFAKTVPCYHLEGPYISRGGAHGAHDPHLMRDPSWEEFQRLQEAAGGRIAIITVAPELPGAENFIRKATAAGVVVAIGHTDGTPEDIHRAVQAGARLSTHLGNGCPPMMDRHKNPIWTQLAHDELCASLICDGFHLPPELVGVIWRVKGIERCILITDAVHVAEMPPGRYRMVGREIELLPTRKVVTVDGECMAGSALSMNRAVAIFQKFAGANLSESLQAATINPARLLGQREIPVSLIAGQLANLIIFRNPDGELHVETVLLNGEIVFKAAA